MSVRNEWRIFHVQPFQEQWPYLGPINTGTESNSSTLTSPAKNIESLV